MVTIMDMDTDMDTSTIMRTNINMVISTFINIKHSRNPAGPKFMRNNQINKQRKRKHNIL